MLQAPAPDRYRFHDLLKDYAVDRALAEEPRADREAAIRRIVSWYLETAIAMARIVSPHREQVPPGEPEPDCHPLAFSSVDEALDWCETERTNLVAATRQAAASGLHEVAWKLPVAALSFFYRRTYWEEWLVSHQYALESARQAGDQRGEAWVLNNIGMAYARQRREQGVSYFQQALDIRRKIGDRQGEAQALNNVAYASLLLGRFDEALAWLRSALDVQREVGNRYGEGITLNNLGEAYIELERPEEAVDWLTQALAVYREINATHPVGDTLGNLGRANLDLGQMDEALSYLRQAEETHHAVGDRSGEAADLTLLGDAYAQVGRIEQAGQVLARALAIFEALGNDEQVRGVTERLTALGNSAVS